jgi:ubiquitin carboxyl-terminal hydrolase 36/42
MPTRLISNYRGLYNTGLTCYLNSLLQRLLHTPEFVEKLAELKHLNRNLMEIHNFIEAYFNELIEIDMIPFIIKQKVEERYPDYAEIRQHDPTEFFLHFIDLLDSYSGNQFTPIFDYKWEEVRKCKFSECLHISIRKNSTLFLNLLSISITSPDGKKNHETLDTCYKYFQVDNMDMNCEQCKRKNIRHSSRMKVTHYPTNLQIHLKRFDGLGQKIEHEVSIPIIWKIPESTYNVICPTYKLKGVTIHLGSSVDDGHYQQIERVVESTGENGWRLLNDNDKPLIINNDRATELINNNGYLLSYEKL